MTARALLGQVALVTGASSGIGAATAAALSAAGAAVVLVARRESELLRVSRALGPGARSAVVAADLTTAQAPDAVVDEACRAFGRVDILVNAAGLVRAGTPVHEQPPKQWQLMLHLNVTVPFLLARRLLPGMRARGHGVIAAIGSALGRQPVAGGGGYAVSKHALSALIEILHAEHADHGISVFAVCPGWVVTASAADPERLGVSREELLSAEDVAQTVLWALTRPPRMRVGPQIDIAPASARASTRRAVESYTALATQGSSFRAVP